VSASQRADSLGESGQDAGQLGSGPRERSLWRNRDYMLWWTGNSISSLGSSISAVAYPLLILYATGSVAKAGAISAAALVGSLVTTIAGGILADRISRRAILIAGPLVEAAALGSVALLTSIHLISVPLLSAVAFIGGTAWGVTSGASSPALRRIVPKEDQPKATAQSMGCDMVAELIGGPVGGVLFVVARFTPFLADAISYTFASLGAALIRTPLGPDGMNGEERGSLMQDLGEAYHFVRAQPFLQFIIMWASVLNVFVTGFTLLFVALVKYRGGSPVEVGLVNSIAVAGGIVGAVIGPAMLNKLRARIIVYAAAWLFTTSMVVVSLLPAPWEIGAVLFVGLLSLVPLNVVVEAYLVRLIPDRLSARVWAMNRFGAQSLQWLGPIGAGLLADWIGVPGAVLVLGLLTLPLSLGLHLTRSLAVLDQSVSEIAELS
jgi:MFS family permease